MTNPVKAYRLQTPWFIVFVIVILYAIAPVVSRAISTYLTNYFMLALVGLVWLYFISWKLNQWFNRLLPILLIAIINSLWSYTHGGDITLTAYSFLLGFLPVMMAYRLPSLPYPQQRGLFRIAAFAVIVTVITSVYGLATHPGAARYIAKVTDSQDPLFVMYDWLNIGGFSFTYLLVSIYPIAICYMKEKRLPHLFRVIFFLILLYYFRSAEYMTALATFAVLSILWFVPRQLTKNGIIVLSVIMVLMFVVFSMAFGELLGDLAADSDSAVLSSRMQYMSDSMRGIKNTDDVGLRVRVLMNSWEGFLNAPLLGNWRSGGGGGGHSFVLDFMCKYGLIGLGLLLWSYKRIYDLFYLPWRRTPYFGYAIASFLACIFLSIVNTGDHWFETCFLIPLTLTMIAHKQIDSATYPHENTMDN